MLFTALHRVLGRPPGPLTDDMLDDAIAEGIVEAADLDWKRDLPEAKGLAAGEFPKDVTAMANAGGGVLVYGITETDKAVTGRVDTGELTEAHARGLAAAAVSAISPPVFGVEAFQLGGSVRAVVVVVPASTEVPHLIYRNHYFGAPIRNGPDTEWMKERQVEAMYRTRFEGAPYRERCTRRAVCRNRSPRTETARGLDRRVATYTILGAVHAASDWLFHRPDLREAGPARFWSQSEARPGLRRWIAPTVQEMRGRWGESVAAVHDDGSVSIGFAIGGSMWEGAEAEAAGGHQVWTGHIESFVAELVTPIQLTAEERGASDYDVKLGIESTGGQQLEFLQESDRMLRTDPHDLDTTQLQEPAGNLETALADVAPFDLTIGFVRVGAHGVTFPGGRPPAFMDLVHQTRDVISQTLGPDSIAALPHAWGPHMGLGYGVMAGDSDPLIDAIGKQYYDAHDVTFTVRGVQLLLVDQDRTRGHYTWPAGNTIALGGRE